MKHIFIINPTAGKADGFDLLRVIYSVCLMNGNDFDFEFTNSIGDATKLAKKNALENKQCIVYSVGGDGTLNEVVNGIVNTDAILGILPFGSGNDFFRMLSDTKIDIISRTINGFIAETNIGYANKTHFINIASLGYDAEVAVNASIMKQHKLIPNDMIYYASIFYTLLSYKFPNVKISFNDVDLEQKITLLAICNGKYYGNGIPIAPTANYKDNLFNICLADKINKARIPFLLTKVLKGEHESFNFVHTYQSDYIKAEAEQPISCNVDGETFTSDSFEFGIVKNKMKVLKPR